MQTKESLRTVADKIWLNHFNHYLYEQGVISEEEKNRMAFKIIEYKSYLRRN